MRVRRGDVVLLNFPFASGDGGKVRPAVVVQCDRNNGRLANTIVAQITSRIQFARSEPTQLIIEADSNAGRRAGLLTDSAVSCENLFTVRHDMVLRKLGVIPSDVMQAIDGCLRESLSLT